MLLNSDCISNKFTPNQTIKSPVKKILTKNYCNTVAYNVFLQHCNMNTKHTLRVVNNTFKV